MTAMMTDRSDGLQIEPRHCRNDIETGLAFDANRLESERVVESADKTVGTDADADRRSARHADVTTGQRARPKARRRREHDPAQGHIIGESELSSEAAHSATIVRRRCARGRRENAIENARRYDNKACRPLAPTAQAARFDIGVSGRRCRQGKTKKRSDKGKA